MSNQDISRDPCKSEHSVSFVVFAKNNLVDSVFFVMTGDIIGKMSRCLLRQETVLCCFVMLEDVILIVHVYVSTDIIAKILCSLFPQVM